jgi:hypothetical protein
MRIQRNCTLNQSEYHVYCSVRFPVVVGVARGWIGWQLVVTRVSSKQSNFFFGSNRNKPKLDLFWLFFSLFRETKKHFFLFVSVGIKTNIIYSKQTKTNRKNLQKTFSIRGSSKWLIFFLGSNRNKPKLNLFRLFFGLLFRETPPKKFFGLIRCFGPV